MSALRRRGQPLASLALVLAGWIAVRAAVWEAPFAAPGLVEVSRPSGPAQVAAGQTAQRAPRDGLLEDAAARFSPPSVPFARPALAVPARASPEPALPLARVPSQSLAGVKPPEPTALPPLGIAPHVAAAHQLLYLAALGRLPLPPGLALAVVPPQPVPAPVSWAAAVATPRWSGDGWVLVRRGQGPSPGGLVAASGFPAYGASQAGGVVRFALAPASGRAPQAYLRLSRALGGFDEGEVAAGLSARPFAAVPLRLLGEARVQRSAGVTRVRPAASLVSELPPVRLPLWSGGQEGAARVDLGPRASVRLDAGRARSRLALDWRFRVAGNARPASGPTLTFSAGF